MEEMATMTEEMSLDLPEGTRLIPTRAGRHQRSQGAWRWVALGPEGVPIKLGSHSTMAELLAADRLIATYDPDTYETSIQDAELDTGPNYRP